MVWRGPQRAEIDFAPNDWAIVLQYGASYSLIQTHADGTLAEGNWYAEKGRIVNGHYIAPHGQVFMDEDLLTYTPSGPDSLDGYEVTNTYRIVLSNRTELPIDKRSLGCRLEPLPASGTIAIPVAGSELGDGQQLEDRLLAPMPFFSGVH